MKKRLNIYVLALCLPALALLSFFAQESESTVSCPYCLDRNDGLINLVPFCRVGCGEPGSALYYYDCHACCSPYGGSSAGHREVTSTKECAKTYVYASIWNGTTRYCHWECSGAQVTEEPNGNGCGFDMIESPNCTYGAFLGYQNGTKCDVNSSPHCS